MLAVAGIIFAAYQTFFYERRGEIVVSVDALSRVFDIHQPVGGLEISYAGENLRSAKKVLWVMNLSITNVGNAEIRKGDYDDLVPVGFQTVGADIVDHPAVKTANEYLRQNLKINTGRDRVALSPVILEPQDSIQISVLLLGPEATKPTITAFGKIAGVKRILVISPEDKGSEKSLWNNLFDTGNLLVYPVRLLIYFVVFILLLALLVGLIAAIRTPIDKFSDMRAVSARRKLALKHLHKETANRETQVLTELFISEGPEVFYRIYGLIGRMKERVALVERLIGKVNDQTLLEIAKQVTPLKNARLTAELQTYGVLSYEGAKPIFSERLEKGLEELSSRFGVDLKHAAKTDAALILEEEELARDPLVLPWLGGDVPVSADVETSPTQ